MVAPKASKKDFLELILQGIDKEGLIERLGYKSEDSINSALYNQFGSTSVERIRGYIVTNEEEIASEKKQKKASPMDNYWTKYPKVDKRAYSDCFNNPIVHCNLLTGEHYNRIEEIWRQEGVTQIQVHQEVVQTKRTITQMS